MDLLHNLRSDGQIISTHGIIISVKSQHRKRILLEIETAIAPGRDMLLGISKFVGEINRWDVHHNAGSWSLHGDNSGPSHIEPLDPKMPVDGVITRIYDTHSLSRAKALVEKGIPVVDILGDHSDSSIPLVHTDDAGIAQLALKHLREQGFTNFGFCGIENTRWSDLRGDHFKNATAKLGCKTSTFYVPKLHFSKSAIYKKLTLSWLHSLPLPIGIFVSCDHIAPILIETAKQIGITIPENIAFVGVNNDAVSCNICNPTLSSIDASHYEIGYRAARLLNQLLEGKAPKDDPIFIPPTKLVVRGSSSELAINDPAVALAARFINRNAGSLIGVDDVVKNVSLSKRELQRRFRQFTGRSIHATIVETRISIAKRLLGNPEYTIDYVAQLSGFSSRQHFAKTFKAATGFTPGAFRKNHSLR